MKSNLNKELNNKKEESNDLLANIIQNITETDFNSKKYNKKRSFSYINFFNEKRNKLLKRANINNEYKEKNFNNNFSPKQIDYINNNISFDNKKSINLNSYRKKEKINAYVSLTKKRPNFILKNEIYDLNTKEEKKPSQFLTNQKENNIIINNNKNDTSNIYLKPGNNQIKNINLTQEPDNLISNYYKNDKNDNIFNQNETKSQNIVNNDKDNKNNNNNINYNNNTIFYSYPFSPMVQYFNYDNCIDINKQIYDNNYISLSKTQSGCQILINKILSNPNFANEILFPYIKKDLEEICTNIFGSSMIKILFQNLTEQNKDIFLSSIKEYIINICQTEIGSRVMQDIIDLIKDNDILLKKLVEYLNNNNLMIMCKSSYGHHFIKYYLSKLYQKEYNNFIYNFIFNNFIELCQDKFGVCIVQKAFSESDKEDFYKLLKLTEQNFNMLINHCFGNYLIQYIFIKIKNVQKFKEFFSLIKLIEENIVEFCKNKYSSAVLEKLFEKGDEAFNEHIINHLLNFHWDEIIYIIIHPNGYYVIKKAMKLKNKNIKKQIIKSLKNNLGKFKSGSRNASIVSSFCNEYVEYL